MFKKKIKRNYLNYIFQRSECRWDEDDKGMVTLYIPNTGLMNGLAQRFLKKPKESQVHLEKFGSFIWKQFDGKLNLLDIASLVSTEFGEEANPLYERLAIYVKNMEQYGLIACVYKPSPNDQVTSEQTVGLEIEQADEHVPTEQLSSGKTAKQSEKVSSEELPSEELVESVDSVEQAEEQPEKQLPSEKTTE